MLLQLVPLGSNCTWPNVFAALVVIEPCAPLLKSLIAIFRPLVVSCIVTVSWSPEFMNRSAWGFGVKVCSVEWTGLAGECGCGLPLFVMKAKLTYSKPAMP